MTPQEKEEKQFIIRQSIKVLIGCIILIISLILIDKIL